MPSPTARRWKPTTSAPAAFTATTQSISFYDSFVVFEKGGTTGKSAPRIGKPLFD